MNIIRNIINNVMLLKSLSIRKTIYLNFHCLEISKAMKFPIYVYKYAKLTKVGCKGTIEIRGKIYRGMIKFAPLCLGNLDHKHSSRAVWEQKGRIIFDGSAKIGTGCSLSVDDGGVLEFGNNFSITGNTDIVCQKNIKFGDDCLLSWDVLIMDYDAHHIMDENGDIINEPAPIIIGNHVWVGCRSTILKGCIIADNTVVAACSVITKKFEIERTIIGGSGKSQAILKQNIEW